MTRKATSKPAAAPLLFSVRDSIAWLTLNRPAAGNAITQPLAQQLISAAEAIELDDSIRLVVLGAAGKSFCVGVEDGGAWERRCRWVAAIGSLSVPVIAAVNGDAIAEGCELALACDLRFLSPRARLQLPQLAHGRLPSQGGTQRLPRIIGRMRALELLLSGRAVEAAEAERIGLATRVLAASSFAADLRRAVAQLAARGPIALRYAKEAVLHGLDLPLDHGIRLEEDLYVLLQTTADRAKGVRAFLQKRRPAFRGD
ncbi:MAG: enoyl-CoA hydratase/isomerase family protein [Deltaproteobacteria bacterium]|nr:enoyl-CoA hydratase/isomerase family protein [Deltaproteobacteria bacterium]